MKLTGPDIIYSRQQRKMYTVHCLEYALCEYLITSVSRQSTRRCMQVMVSRINTASLPYTVFLYSHCHTNKLSKLSLFGRSEYVSCASM